jgi:hypothetical protein
MNYQPNDSEFGDAYRAWQDGGYRSLTGLSQDQLDDFASVADSKLNTPAYADDADLARFRQDCEDMQREIAEEREEIELAEEDGLSFDNRDQLERMSAAAKAGTPGMETHPDYRKPSAMQEHFEAERDRAGEDALRKLAQLREAIDGAEREIQKGIGGNPMVTSFARVSHQLLNEVPTSIERFVTLWDTAGLLERQS